MPCIGHVAAERWGRVTCLQICFRRGSSTRLHSCFECSETARLTTSSSAPRLPQRSRPFWCVAEDKPLHKDHTCLTDDMVLARKKSWLTRHDQQTGGIMGLLPLVKGMPIRLTKTVQSPRQDALQQQSKQTSRLATAPGGPRALAQQHFPGDGVAILSREALYRNAQCNMDSTRRIGSRYHCHRAGD